jgi:uncharacterized protein (DUF488 family)
MGKTAKKRSVKKKTAAKKPATKKSTGGKVHPLFTIGYEQAKPAVVLDELKQAHVDTLVDVRAIAASRRPGFSKKQLAAELDAAGIGYIHLQKLGTPADGRQAARAGDRETLLRIYEKHISKAEAQAELEQLTGLIETGKRIALLCYCRDPATCHRSRIVAHLDGRIRLKVENLIPPLF